MVSLLEFHLSCSTCNVPLLSASVMLAVEVTALEKDIFFHELNIVCPVCQKHLQDIEDDLTRDITAYWDSLE